MKLANIAGLFVFCLVLSGLVQGCGKEDVSATRKPEGYSMAGGGQDSSRPAEGDFAAGDLEPLDRTGVNPLDMALQESDEYLHTYGRSTAPLFPVFFDFDSSAINEDQIGNLTSSGNYLMESGSPALVVEGNCDSRGTADYNLALGEMRALNVKRYLVNLGVSESSISTISFGSQRPLFHGDDERSWAGNRRADLVIQ